MKLLSTSELGIRRASPYTDTELASSELLLNGKPSGVIVTGEVLEAAVEWRGYHIVFLTDDIPFEDMLRIYMFDANMVLVDAAVLGAMYSTGTFAELSLQTPDALSFRFFGGTRWRVVLLTEREFALPFVSDPSGVSRKFKFSRYFRVEGKPQPERRQSISGQSETTIRTQIGSLRSLLISATASSPDTVTVFGHWLDPLKLVVWNSRGLHTRRIQANDRSQQEHQKCTSLHDLLLTKMSWKDAALT